MADDKKNIGPEAEKPGEAPQEKKAEPVKDTPPVPEQPAPGAPQAPMVETAPKAQTAPTVESQPEEKAAPAPKVLDFSAAKNKAPAKEETALEKKPVKEQAAEKPKRGRPAKTDKAPAEKPKPPRDKMSQSKKAPGKEAPIPPKPEAAPKEAKAPEQEQPAAPRDATRSAEPEQIVYINLSELHPFKNHPFGVRDDSEMKGLVESVKASGVNQPALVRPREDGGYTMWIIELYNGVRIGDLCFKGLDSSGIVEIGYGILEEYQGQGYATEAVKVVTDWAFQSSKVVAIEAETDAQNTASQRVLEKCGFIANGEWGNEGPRFVLSR